MDILDCDLDGDRSLVSGSVAEKYLQLRDTTYTQYSAQPEKSYFKQKSWNLTKTDASQHLILRSKNWSLQHLTLTSPQIIHIQNIENFKSLLLHVLKQVIMWMLKLTNLLDHNHGNPWQKDYWQSSIELSETRDIRIKFQVVWNTNVVVSV